METDLPPAAKYSGACGLRYSTNRSRPVTELHVEQVGQSMTGVRLRSTSESTVSGGKLRVSPATVRRARMVRITSDEIKDGDASAVAPEATRTELTNCFCAIGPLNSTNVHAIPGASTPASTQLVALRTTVRPANASRRLRALNGLSSMAPSPSAVQRSSKVTGLPIWARV